MKEKKKQSYQLSDAFLFTGLIPALRIEGESTFYLWFNDILVRDRFIEKALTKYEGELTWEKEHIHINSIDRLDLLMGKFIFKAKKKKSRTVPLLWVYDFYQQAVDKVVDKL